MSGPPPALLELLRSRLGEISVGERVGGGCINPAVRVELNTGSAFLKYNESAPPGFFTAEANGLAALRAGPSRLYVPAVLSCADAGEPGGVAHLLLEWLERGEPGDSFGSELGRGLAELHRTSGGWGWEGDGFIGPLPVSNDGTSTWAEFWRERRLRPQYERALRQGWRIGDEKAWEALWGMLDDLLAPAENEGPSLLHGDLWSGNVLAARRPGGVVPALVDPAAYRGHREVDLAMAELFGGFPSGFLPAYDETWSIVAGYRTGRRAAYQLFYLLVHVNLFGGGYVPGAQRVLREVLAAR